LHCPEPAIAFRELDLQRAIVARIGGQTVEQLHRA
jgi:hypothetical protein